MITETKDVMIFLRAQQETEQYERLASVMNTLAKLPAPHLDTNIKAGSPFQAYCFFRSVLTGV